MVERAAVEKSYFRRLLDALLVSVTASAFVWSAIVGVGALTSSTLTREWDWGLIGSMFLVLLVPVALLAPLLALKKRKSAHGQTGFGLGLMGGVWLLNAGINAQSSLTKHDHWQGLIAAGYMLVSVFCYVELYRFSKRMTKEIIH